MLSDQESQDAVTNKTFAQCWSLDATGNWRKFTEDSNGDGAWDLDQLRTSNKVNEITDVSEYSGPAWVTPAYNRAGNMTTIPKPAQPTASFTATYDAWNRLVKLEDGSGTVSQYEYDGAKRRTVKRSYTGDVLTETRHFYYTEPSKWQVVEERVDSETDPDRQFVWGQRYIDDLVLRDRDTDADGDLDERLFAMQDANWNVTGIVDSAGDVQERYSYTAYGCITVLTPACGIRGVSIYGWESTYVGYRIDWHTHLLIVRHRVLNGHFGAWLQRDPLKLAAAENLYEYVHSRPTLLVDPSGLLAQLVPVAVVVAGILFVIIVTIVVFVVAVVLLIAIAMAIELFWQMFPQYCGDPPVDATILHDPTQTENDKQLKKCKLKGEGGCNKKTGWKRCTYMCEGGPATHQKPIRCGPKVTPPDPNCPWEIEAWV
jgi:RHS repeat-associated protein